MPLVLYICRTKIEQNTQILAKEPLERRPRVTNIRVQILTGLSPYGFRSALTGNEF
jgi:hypothetical protein